MNGVDKELRAATVGPTGVGHRQRSGFIGQLGVLRVLVRDRAVGRSARARPRTLGILAVGATELDHEPVDHAVKVQSVIEAGLGQIDEVLCRDRHFVAIHLDLEITQTGFERRRRIGH